MVHSAIDIAKWFIKEGLDNPRNTFDGNMKLQKLIFFSQLIHLAKHNQPLFNDPMYAFKNGTVVNNVRLKYRDNHHELIMDSKNLPKFDQSVENTLNLTASIFGHMTAKELSDLNHELDSWKMAYKASETDLPDHYNRERSVIQINDILTNDIHRIRQMLESYEENVEDNGIKAEVVNGVTFYYDPRDIYLTDEIMETLENFTGDEKFYTIYNDSKQGIVIY